ncbi:chloride transport protein 6-like [Argonauta hians]
MTLGKCHRLSQLDPNGGGGNGSMLNMTSTRNYFCPEGYYNDMATLFFNPQEIAIKQLFHQQGNFSPSTLAIFFLFFFLLSCWTYGVCVPSGLFVPSLLCGAAYGRLVASILQFWGYQSGYAGTYALIGAAAFLGGVVRMTISLTVILIESTNEISYGLPIMLVLMIAKWIGDLFNQGLYDIHINLKNIPLLEWDSPAVMDRLTAADIMKDKVLYVFPHTRISTIEQILKTTAHNVFPVVSYCTPATEATDATRRTPQQRCYQDLSLLRRVDPQSESNKRTKLEGIILRTQLTVLLKNGVFFEEGSDPLFQKLLTYEEMTADYPRFPGIHEIDPAPILADKLLDVSPYMNPCPYTVYPNTPVSQVFQLFRSMGLRHLPVVSHDGEVVGMVTRHDLTHEHLESCLRRHQRQMEYIRQEQIRRDLRE